MAPRINQINSDCLYKYCCFVLGIDRNKFTVSLPSTFYDDAPNKFYRTGLKFLSLTSGRRCDCSSHHCILYIRATTFFDKYLYCTIYNIVHWRGSTEDPSRNVCICNVLSLH